MSKRSNNGNGMDSLWDDMDVTSIPHDLDGVIAERTSRDGQRHMTKDQKRNVLMAVSSQSDIARAREVREQIVDIWNEKVIDAGRNGAKKMLDWLDGPNCDYFIAPASTRYHGAVIGGLAMHSLNVYWCLRDVLRGNGNGKTIYQKLGVDPSDDTIAIIALLHDLCKTNFYSVESRQRKVEGIWESYPFFSFDDKLPYGHGEKSELIASRIMSLDIEEAIAIRHHMGFSSCLDQQQRGYFSQTVQEHPLALAAAEADTRASLLLE